MSSNEKPQAVVRAQEWLDSHEAELIEDLRGLLRIPSIEGEAEKNAPFGAEVREALDYVLDLGRKWRMRTKDVDGYAGHAEFGDSDNLIMALGHIDVVPVSDEWKHPPFGAEIDGDYIYSRGAIDDKGPTMAAFYAARALLETDADLPARMRLVFGCDEESGFKCVEHYFQREEAPTFGVAPDSGWPLFHAEKGIANLVLRVPCPTGLVSLLSLRGGSRPNIVIDKARAMIHVSPEVMGEALEKTQEYWDKNVSFEIDGNRIIIDATGKAAHGSTPFAGDSAFVRLMRAVVELAPPVQQKHFANILEIGHPSGVGLGIHLNDDVPTDLTSNVGVVETDGGALIMTVNIRYPVTMKGEDVKAACERFLLADRVAWSIDGFDDSPPLYFPVDQEPVSTIVDVYRLETGDETPPGVMGGGTYARAVPNTVSIGTGWEGDGPAHENDERIHVAHPLKMAKIYAHILYRLAHAANK